MLYFVAFTLENPVRRKRIKINFIHRSYGFLQNPIIFVL